MGAASRCAEVIHEPLSHWERDCSEGRVVRGAARRAADDPSPGAARHPHLAGEEISGSRVAAV
jgi:hypothetical protein